MAGADSLRVLQSASPRRTLAAYGGLLLVAGAAFAVFFAFTGMRTQIGLLADGGDFATCALVIAVATAGKLGGTFVAARLSGLGTREASALGILMNTRGSMELIVLNVGLDMGVLSPRLFAIFVLMAVVTTFATTPALNLLYGGRMQRAASPE